MRINIGSKNQIKIDAVREIIQDRQYLKNAEVISAFGRVYILIRNNIILTMDDNKMPKSEEEWETCLTPEQYEILRRKGTEAPFTGKYYKHHETGMYVCGACGQELFSSDAKFDSGTGWPSFTDPINKENVDLKIDTSHGMIRTEVICRKCGSHLGHVFDDLPAEVSTKAGGPKDRGGKRYCINSLALDFEKKK